LQPSTTPQVLYYNQFNNITIRTTLTIPTYLNTRVYCTLTNDTATVRVLTGSTVNQTDFVCSLPPQFDISQSSIGFSYFYSDGNTVLSSNSIPLVFVRNDSMSLRTDKYYDFGYVNSPNWTIAVNTNSQLQPVGVSSQVVCRHETDGIYLPTFVINSTSFGCNFTETAPRYVTFSLWIIYNSNSILLSSKSITIPILDLGRIAHVAGTSANGALVSAQFQTVMTLQSWTPTVSALSNRIVCIIDNILSTWYPATFNGTTYACTLSFATPGIHNASLYMSSLSSALPYVIISNNSLPIVIVEQVRITVPPLPQPFSSINLPSASINLALDFNVTHSGTIDNYYQFGGQVTYACTNDSITMYPATWNVANNSLSCSLISSNVPMIMSIDVYIISVATNTRIKWSISSTWFLFYKPYAINTLNPFVIPYNITSDTSSITVNLASSLITCSYIYMGYFNGVSTDYKPATCDELKLAFTAPLTVSNFNPTNTTVTPIQLVYGYNGTYTNLISTSDVYLTYIRTPIDFVTSPSVFQPASLTWYNLSFAIPDIRTQLQFVVTYQQDTSSISVTRTSPMTTYNLLCDFTSTYLINPNCTFTSIIPDYVPIKLTFAMAVTRTNQSGTTTIALTPHYYKQEININKTLPYFTDTMSTFSTPMTFTFTADVKLHPKFAFNCQRISGINILGTATVTISGTDLTQFTCSFTSSGMDHTETMTLLYGDVLTSSDIGNYPLSLADLNTGVVASGTNGSIEFNTLSVLSPYMSATDNATFTLVYNNTDQPYIVPQKYFTSPTITVMVNEAFTKYPCTIDPSTGVVQFIKNTDITNTAGGTNVRSNIQSLQFSLFLDLSTAVSTPIASSTFTSREVLYTRNSFTSKLPRAVLRGSSASVTYTFESNTLSNTLTQIYQLFCQSNYTSDNKIIYPCYSPSSTILVCSVTYNTTQLVQNLYVPLFPYLKVPSLNTSEVIISKNSYDDDLSRLYYIDQGLIAQYPTNQPLFLFTQKQTSLQVQFTSTSMPNTPYIQSTYIYCKYDFVSGTSVFVRGAFISSSIVSPGVTSYVYNCTNTFMQGVVGRASVSLWYNENDPTGASFQISTNSIEVVYTDPINLIAVLPFATRVNLTVATTLQTSFISSADYGNASYVIRYYYVNTTSIMYQYMATASSTGGYFGFSINSSIAGSINIDLIMTTKNMNLTINSVPITFTFVDGNFFTPSWGTLEGGAATYMYAYDGPSNVQNITFLNDPSTYFPCTRWQDPITSLYQLNCTTPKITKYTPFQSFIPVLAGKNIEIKYIIIDMRNITTNSTVFPTGTTINTKILLNRPVAFNTSEGTAILQISSLVLTSAIRDDIGVLNNTQLITRSFSSLPAGSYSMTLMYQNPNLFELRSMIAFTNSIPLTFIDSSDISFVSGSNSSGLLKQSFDIFINLGGLTLTSDIKSKIQCKFDSNWVTVLSTTDVSGSSNNQLKCTVMSSQALVSKVSLWYVNSDAYNSGFQLSTSALTILFMEKLNISTTPWATLSQTQSITLATSITSDASLFSSYLTYSCRYYDATLTTPVYYPATATRTIGDNTFTCTVPFSLGSSKYIKVNVDLEAKPSATSQTLIISSVPTSLYVMKQVNLTYISPFVQAYQPTTTSDTVNVTIPLSPESAQYTDIIVTDYQLYCKYSTVDQQSWLYTPAYLMSSNKATCKITVTHSKQVELINVRLWYNGGAISNMSTAVTSPYSFDLSGNSVTFMFIQQPLLFNDTSQVPFNGVILRPTVINQYLFMNLAIPTQWLPTSYRVNMNAIEGSSYSSLSNCVFTPGTQAKCVIVDSTLSVLRVPILFNFTLTLTNTISTEQTTLSMKPLTYMETTNIQRAYPYALSYTEYSSTSRQVTFTVDRTMNVLYNYQCWISSQSGSYYYSSATLYNGNMYSCGIKSFNTPEVLPVQLQFLSPSTLYANTTSIPITANNASISFIKPIQMKLPVAPVPLSGPVIVNTITALPSPPTSYFSNANYGMSLVITDRNTQIPMSNCSVYSTSYIQCNLTSNLQFPSYPWYVTVDLYMMNGTTRSLSLSPKFTFFKSPTFTSILPSNMILRVTAVAPTSYLDIYGTNFYYSTYALITVTYSCTTCTSVITGTGTEVQTCKYVSSTQITCPSPQFNYNSGVTTSTLGVTVSMGGSTFPTYLYPTLYDASAIGITGASNTICNPFTSQTITVTGNNFVNGSIWVQFGSAAPTRSGVKYLSATSLTVQSQVLWTAAYNYPIVVGFKISFDNGVNYVPTQQMLATYVAPPAITFSPSSYAVGKYISGMTLTNFPSVTVDTDEQVVLYLVDSYGTNITMNCTNSFTSCSSTSPLPNGAAVLTFVAYAVNSAQEGRMIHLTFASVLRVYQHASASAVFPPRLFLSLSNTLQLTGNFLTLPTNSFTVWVRQNNVNTNLKVISVTATTLTVSGLSSISLSVPGTRAVRQSSDIDIMVALKDSSFSDMLLSTNTANGVPTMTMLPKYSITSSLNNDFQNDPNSAFSFQETHLTLLGNSFLTTNDDSIRIKFKHAGLFENIYYPQNVSMNIIDQGTIKLTAPALNNLTSSNEQLRFPLTVDIGLSYNWGVDYTTLTINYMNSYRQPILTGLSPSIYPRQEMTMTIQGKYLTVSTYCIFDAPAIGEYITPVTHVLSGNVTSDYAVTCVVPQWIADNKQVTSLSVKVTTSYAENSTSITFTYHDTLDIQQVYPSSGSTVGGDIINVYVTNVLQGFNLYARFSELISTTPCTLWQYQYSGNVSVVNCTVLSHANGDARVMVSYDQINWFMQGGYIYNSSAPSVIDDTYNYNYIPCQAGYTASDFSQQCTPCPLGTYKPSAGVYACIPCTNGTFNPYSAQVNCSSCPLLTSSAPNSTNYYSCVCSPGYYYNPRAVMGQNISPCLGCPKGAVCNDFNTTIPPALNGYWHDGADPYNYFNCFPQSACPGGSTNNCSAGYDARSKVCGICSRGYYKWRNQCTICSSDVWWKLIVAIVVGFIIAVAFFAISAAKASHLASISIALSFFQVISMFSNFDVAWPTVVDGTITASSVANLNMDFLSPQCIFPEMDYFTKWTVTTLLPFYFLVIFFLLYLFGVIRAKIINLIPQKYRIQKNYLVFCEDDDDDENENENVKMTPKMFILEKLGFAKILLKNMIIYFCNSCLWLVKEGGTAHELHNFGNKIINSYTAFISFMYLYIMAQLTQPLVCTQQADGSYTLNASPDVVCYVGYGTWVNMVPLMVIIFLIFGSGVVLFFVVLFIISTRLRHRRKILENSIKELENRDHNETDNTDEELDKLKHKLKNVIDSQKTFNMRFKFMLTRFRGKYFYWEAVITLRKLLLTILYTFLPSMLVLVFGIVIAFIALLLHMQAVPFRYKFHNFMEYLVLISTCLVLFLGLLFFVDVFPTSGFETFCIWLVTIIIVLSAVLVIFMIFWDFLTRRKKEKKKVKQQKQQIQERLGDIPKSKLKKEFNKMFPSVFKTQMLPVDPINELYKEDLKNWKITENELCDDKLHVFCNPLLDVTKAAIEPEYYEGLGVTINIAFLLPFYDDDEEFEEGDELTLNQITEDLFGVGRLTRKGYLVKRKLRRLFGKAKKQDDPAPDPNNNEQGSNTLELVNATDMQPTTRVNEQVILDTEPPAVERPILEEEITITEC
jgi:cytochrome c-type biogenesis protein CcmH/NrfF